MGLGGLANGIVGYAGGAPHIGVPNANSVTRNYLGLVRGFNQGAQPVFDTEAAMKPQYTRLGLQDLGLSLNGDEKTPGMMDLWSRATKGVSDTQRSLNPGGASLWDKLNAQAGEGLDAGASLDPDLQRLFSQSVRGGQAARGMGFGPSDVFSESLGLTQFGQGLRQQRQGFASGVANMDQARDMSLLGFGQSLLGQAQGQGQGSVPTLFPAQAQYDMYNTAYNARAGANIANQNAQVALEQGMNSFS